MQATSETTDRSPERDLRLLAIPVAVVVALHLTWAVLFFLPGAHPGNATAASLVRQMVGSNAGAGILMAAVGLLAAYGLWTRVPIRRVAFLLPQQAVLAMSAAGAFRAMWLSHFADGVVRDRGFIIADQAPAVLLLLAHTVVIFVLIAAWLDAHGR